MKIRDEKLKEGVFGIIKPFPKAGDSVNIYAIKDTH
jgi:hypothetical protein